MTLREAALARLRCIRLPEWEPGDHAVLTPMQTQTTSGRKLPVWEMPPALMNRMGPGVSVRRDWEPCPCRAKNEDKNG